MKIIKPKKIKKGAVIAIVSPSSAIIDFKKRTDRAISFLESKGYEVIMMPNSQKTDGYSGGTAEERAYDINTAFARKDVDMILCSTGGITANAILPFLDYNLIKNNPKVFCGFSDITTLNLMITSETGLVTFNGPTLLPSFGEFEGSVGFTFDDFEKTLNGEKKAGSIFPESKNYSIDNLFWGKDDNRSLEMVISPTPYSLGKKGVFNGRLFGGNLQTFVMLMNEKNFLDLKGKILFLEEEGLSSDWYERYLSEIDRKGIFKEISALIFAKPSGSFLKRRKDIRNEKKLLEEISQRNDNLPILANVDCGHTKPLLTFPLGVEVAVDTDQKQISYLESPVI